MPRIATAASHDNRKMMANHWQNRDNKQWQNRDKKSWQNKDKKLSWHGKIRIKSHGKTTRAKVINPETPVLHCPKIKNSLFQQIVMRTCSRSSAPWLKCRSTRQSNQAAMGKEINEISKDTLVNLLNISGETYDAAQSAVQQVEKAMKFHLLRLPLTY